MLTISRRRLRLLRVLGCLSCVGAGVAWRASGFGSIRYNSGTLGWAVAIGGGDLIIWKIRKFSPDDLGFRYHILDEDDRSFGFNWPYRIGAAFFLPLWVVLLACMLVTAVFFAMRARPARTEVCRTCGYDLTGNESGRCPECGCPVGQDSTYART